MELRFVKGDFEHGKFKLQFKKAEVWEDVPCVELPKLDDLQGIWNKGVREAKEKMEERILNVSPSKCDCGKTLFGSHNFCFNCGVKSKKTRKLIDIFDEVMKPWSEWSYNDMAEAAIEAVIECYGEWIHPGSALCKTISFPEYLKEKML